MRRELKRILLLLLVIVVVAGCGGKKEQTKNSALAMLEDSVGSNGWKRMQVSETEINISFKGVEYRAFIARTPDEKLDKVVDEMGDTYVDNRIVLRLNRGRQQLFYRAFVKNDFVSLADADFLSHAILEGLVFDKTTSEGLVFAASICYPQTDLYIPFSITLTTNGKMVVKKVDQIEEVYESEAE